MTTLKKVVKLYKGSTHGPYMYYKQILVNKKPISLNQRYSSNIHIHINNRAGLFNEFIPIHAEQVIKIGTVELSK